MAAFAFANGRMEREEVWMISRLIISLPALALLAPTPVVFSAENDLSDVEAQVTKQHDEAVKRLRDWIAQVSIAAENRGYPEAPIT